MPPKTGEAASTVYFDYYNIPARGLLYENSHRREEKRKTDYEIILKKLKKGFDILLSFRYNIRA